MIVSYILQKKIKEKIIAVSLPHLPHLLPLSKLHRLLQKLVKKLIGEKEVIFIYFFLFIVFSLYCLKGFVLGGNADNCVFYAGRGDRQRGGIEYKKRFEKIKKEKEQKDSELNIKNTIPKESVFSSPFENNHYSSRTSSSSSSRSKYQTISGNPPLDPSPPPLNFFEKMKSFSKSSSTKEICCERSPYPPLPFKFCNIVKNLNILNYIGEQKVLVPLNEGLECLFYFG
jgi:hypothetical protein